MEDAEQKSNQPNVETFAVTETVSTFTRAKRTVTDVFEATTAAFVRMLDKCETAEDLEKLKQKIRDIPW